MELGVGGIGATGGLDGHLNQLLVGCAELVHLALSDEGFQF